MKIFARSLVKYVLSRSNTGRKFLFSAKKFLHYRRLHPFLEETGWFRSAEERVPVDRDGNCLPWFTYPAISFLNRRIQSDMTAFEYGSGNSTLWLSQKVSRVVSYEHDFSWYCSMKERVPSNVEYRHCDLEYGGDYCKAILGYNDRFNIVLIDGRDRVNCVKNSLGALRENGVIVWDNTERESYQEGYSYLTRNGFRRLDFEGHGPVNTYRWCTSIFYRSNNCFGI